MRKHSPVIKARILALIASLSLVATSLSLVAACASDKEVRRYSRAQAQSSLARLEKPGLVIGDFKLARDAVLDGDTVKVEGLDTTLRLLGIDTEETFKHDDDRRDAQAGFAAYLAARRGASKHPVKAATPMGEAAKKWAKEFFRGVATIRLERDHPRELRGLYGRYLAYIMVEKDGIWYNYNVEAVRAGMSPYFSKYGYSRRFHDQFVVAEKQARRAKRGIWDPDAEKYPDYEERKRWWDARADFIRDFEREAGAKENYIPLTRWDSLQRLEAHVDREVVILGTVAKVIHGDKGPSRVLLSRRRTDSVPVVFFDKDVFGMTGIADAKGEFVSVRAKVSRYYNKYRKQDELQLVVDRPSQVVVAPVPAFGDGDASDQAPADITAAAAKAR